MTASCSACGQEWPHDPALEVAYPTCHAPEGVKCRRPSGHGCSLHPTRDRLAMERGFLGPYPAAAPRAETFCHDLPLFTFATEPTPERTIP